MEVSGRFNPRGKSPWYPLERRMYGPQSRTGRGGGEEKVPVPAGNRILVVTP
jgi:hypothetical protein